MSDNVENRVYHLEVKMESLETFLEKKITLEFQFQNSKIDSLEKNIKSEISSLDSKISSVKTELKSEINSVKSEINSVKSEVGSVRWMMGLMLSVLLANVGISLGIFYFIANHSAK